MKIPVMEERDWSERTSAPKPPLKQTDAVFESFFERTLDAVWLFDPTAGVFVDCNEAAVSLIGAKNKEQVLQLRPEQLSPAIQPDGVSSVERTAEIVALVEKNKNHRFEWMMRHMDGRDVPLEVSCTAIVLDGRNIMSRLRVISPNAKKPSRNRAS